MKTKWDYTELAEAYLKRPDYAPEAIEGLFKLSQLTQGASVCDIGAGVAHLTLPLLKKGFQVIAVEPNDTMRAFGQMRTRNYTSVRWYEGTGEKTDQADQAFDLVTFGSSFNVCDRQLALTETKRILKPSGWFACLWNHRNLDDPIQAKIEEIIQKSVPDYNYGVRRKNQQCFLEDSGYFQQVYAFTGHIVHTLSTDDVVTAWRSHATLQRQAGKAFQTVILEIQSFLNHLSSEIQIPYTTRLWCAQLRR